MRYSTPDLLKWISFQWHFYSKYLDCTKFASQLPSSISSVSSSFKLFLINTPWVHVKGKNYKPGDILTCNSKLVKLFDGIIPALDTDISSDIYKCLGFISDTISLSNLLSCLSNLSLHDDFQISTNKIAEVYEYIRTSLLPTAPKEEAIKMRETKFIFVPYHPAESKNFIYRSDKWSFSKVDEVAGQFYYPHECVLKDAGNVIDSERSTTFHAESIKLMSKFSTVRSLALYYGEQPHWTNLYIRKTAGFGDYLPVS